MIQNSQHTLKLQKQTQIIELCLASIVTFRTERDYNPIIFER